MNGWMSRVGGLILAAGLSASAFAQTPTTDWPQFLGPHRDGISSETGLLDAWPAQGPKQVWRVEGGVGMSGLAIVGDQLVTMLQRDGQQRVVALDSRTGQRRWETPVAPEYKNSMGNGPRATPTIHGERVFAFTGEGILVALQRADGKILWKHHVLEELGGKEADYGMASSPLVVGSVVVVLAGSDRGTLAAYDLATGKLAWTSGQSPVSYSSPTLLTIEKTPMIVAAAGAAIEGFDPATGRLLWSYPYATDFQCNIAVPLAAAGGLFVSAGENHGSAYLRLRRSGEKYEVEEVWTSFGPKSVLRNEWQTSIQSQGYLFGLDNVGGAGPITHLACVELATGKRVWQQTRFGKSNLIMADGKLFFSTMQGELVIVKADPKSYQELGRATVTGPTRQAPALSRGHLYLRDDAEIVCLDVRK
ncbi:MAG: PQQ-binding-like beta-propeller repeat protein [Pirellulales bacterium]